MLLGDIPLGIHDIDLYALAPGRVLNAFNIGDIVFQLRGQRRDADFVCSPGEPEGPFLIPAGAPGAQAAMSMSGMITAAVNTKRRLRIAFTSCFF